MPKKARYAPTLFPGNLRAEGAGGYGGEETVSCRERKPIIRAAIARLVRFGRWHLVALLLVLAACATLSKNLVLFRPSGDARLVTRVKEGLFLATVRIGDREASPFLIDTGATAITLDAELAKALHLSFWREVDIPEFKQKLKWGTVPSLEVGPLIFQNPDVAVLDLSSPVSLLGERFAGLLGYPFFARVVVEIDYPAGSVACFDPTTYRLPRGEWMPLSFQAGVPVLAARLDGNIGGQFQLDTGSNFTVLFSPEFVQRHALLEHRETRPYTTVRVDGPHEVRRARIAWFELAGRRFEQPLVTFAPADMHRSFPKGIAGVIGGSVLREFTVVFNYPESKIALLPR